MSQCPIKSNLVNWDCSFAIITTSHIESQSTQTIYTNNLYKQIKTWSYSCQLSPLMHNANKLFTVSFGNYAYLYIITVLLRRVIYFGMRFFTYCVIVAQILVWTCLWMAGFLATLAWRSNTRARIVGGQWLCDYTI